MKGFTQLGTLTTSRELDAYKLSSKDDYAVYYNMLLHALDQVIKSKVLKLAPQEQELLVEYIAYLVKTIRALRIRYLYDDEHSIRLDVHESGFPSFIELRNMYNELLVKRETAELLPSVDVLKKQVVDFICTSKTVVPDELMNKVSTAYYASTFKPEDIFYRGVMSKLQVSSNPEAPANSYFISWSAYDNLLNRPLVFFMYFTYSGDNIQDDLPEIQSNIRNNGDYLRELALTANTIDKNLPNVHPKLLKCIDIGPFCSMFSKEEEPMAITIVNGVNNRVLPPQSYCLNVTLDVLRSIGETEVKSGIFGNKHQIFQKYYTPSSNQRGASDTFEYNFGPHSLLQYYNANKIEITNYIPVPEIETDNIKKQL